MVQREHGAWGWEPQKKVAENKEGELEKAREGSEALWVLLLGSNCSCWGCRRFEFSPSVLHISLNYTRQERVDGKH